MAIPHSLLKPLAAILLLLGICSYFTMPAFQGKTLRQYDILQHKGMSKEIADYKEKGETIYWTNSMFSGMPAYMVSTEYNDGPIHALNYLLRIILPHPAALVFLLLLGFFIMLLALGVEPFLAVAGAVAYGFSTYFIIVIGAGHNAKAHAMAYLPPLFAGLLLCYRGKLWTGAALFALFFALELKANHPQMIYYFGFVLVAVVVGEAIRTLREKSFNRFLLASLLLLAGACLGAGAHYAYLKTTSEYGRYTIRGGSELKSHTENKTSGLDRDYVTQWSYGIDETLTLLIPNFKGGESTPLSAYKEALRHVPATLRDSVGSLNAYWGDQPFTAGPVYAGASVILLFLFSLWVFRESYKWPLLFVLVLTIALSWGKNFTTLPIGVIVLAFFQMGFSLYVKGQKSLSDSQKITLLRSNLLVTALLLALTLFGPLKWGPSFPLTDWFLDYFPAYNKFRAVASILVVAEFILPTMAFLGLAPFVLQPEKFKDEAHLAGIPLRWNYLQVFLVTASLLGAFTMAFALIPQLFTSFYANGEEEQLSSQLQSFGLGAAQIRDFLDHLGSARSVLLKRDAWRSFLFVLLTGGVVWSMAQFKLRPAVSALLLIGVVSLDMVPINFRYLPKENWVDKKKYEKEAIPLTKADEVILRDSSTYYRVANMAVSTFNDATTSYRHKSIGGYHGAKLRRYQDVIENMLRTELDALENVLTKKPSLAQVDSALAASKALNMLNVKYLIYSPEAPPIPNRHAMGNAWFVSRVRAATDADEELKGTKEANVRTTAVLPAETVKQFNILMEGPSDSSARIRLVSYHPERLEYEVFSTYGGCAVFSEIYYPREWHAFVDGKEVPILRANYILRGLHLEPGAHRVVFEFRSQLPERLKVSTAFSYVLSVLVLAGLGMPILQKLKHRRSRTAR
ncbi:MAG: YfhO family protein [Flavobacteriales bacterium]|nr:YfhO family protein [Flavobacteriales bacterium]MDW8409064.1 hypothetical protein [Flavobacteriales bacterium]